jgi:hydrogenase maturation protease
VSAVAPAPLLVAMGNPLRGDDGVGWLIADAVERAGAPAGARVVRCRQLLPELAVAVASASAVVLVDAAVDVPPGAVRVTPVAPVAAPEVSPHDLSPGALLALARVLAGAAPPAWLVAVGGARFSYGEGLSAPVRAAVPAAAAAARSRMIAEV